MKQVSDKDLAQAVKFLTAYLSSLEGGDWKRAELRRKVSLLIKKLSKVQFLLNAIFII